MRSFPIIILLSLFLSFVVSAHDSQFHESKSNSEKPPARHGGQVKQISGHWIEVVHRQKQLKIFIRSAATNEKSENPKSKNRDLEKQSSGTRSFDLEAAVIFLSRPGLMQLDLRETDFGWQSELEFDKEPRVTLNLKSKARLINSGKDTTSFSESMVRIVLEKE